MNNNINKLKSLVWDGQDRIADLYEALNIVHYQDMKTIRHWFYDVAAAYLNNAVMPVIHIIGPQAIGKTVLQNKIVDSFGDKVLNDCIRTSNVMTAKSKRVVLVRGIDWAKLNQIDFAQIWAQVYNTLLF